MLKSWGSFDTTIKLCLQAYKKENIIRYVRLLETLESTYYKFDEDWRIFKEDLIKKFGSEDAFNATTAADDGVAKPNITYDSWSDLFFEYHRVHRVQIYFSSTIGYFRLL